jgi:hypothetical protein
LRRIKLSLQSEAPAVQEGDLAAAIKRIPAVADARRSLAQALRAIRRMNPPVAKQALRSVWQQREKALQDWGATLQGEIPVDQLLFEVFGALLIRYSPVGDVPLERNAPERENQPFMAAS